MWTTPTFKKCFEEVKNFGQNFPQGAVRELCTAKIWIFSPPPYGICMTFHSCYKSHLLFQYKIYGQPLNRTKPCKRLNMNIGRSVKISNILGHQIWTVPNENSEVQSLLSTIRSQKKNSTFT